MKDWEVVLKRWYQRGRTGLTIHALATICNRDPLVILKEIFHTRHVGAFVCSRVQEVVFCYSEDPYRAPGMLQRAKKSLIRWPWPENKGIRFGEGTSKLHIIRPKQLLRPLDERVEGL